jgi:hypothetical protein
MSAMPSASDAKLTPKQHIRVKELPIDPNSTQNDTEPPRYAIVVENGIKTKEEPFEEATKEVEMEVALTSTRRMKPLLKMDTIHMPKKIRLGASHQVQAIPPCIGAQATFGKAEVLDSYRDRRQSMNSSSSSLNTLNAHANSTALLGDERWNNEEVGSKTCKGNSVRLCDSEYSHFSDQIHGVRS